MRDAERYGYNVQCLVAPIALKEGKEGGTANTNDQGEERRRTGWRGEGRTDRKGMIDSELQGVKWKHTGHSRQTDRRRKR